MSVLVAPDTFRGSLPAALAAQAICAGLADGGLPAHALALADGGEGFLDVLLGALGGHRVDVATVDALGRPLMAPIGVAPHGIGVVETALAIGHAPLGGLRDPVAAGTEGAGLLVAAALDHGCTEVLVGVGGSATTDGGSGAIAALGERGLRGARVRIACDVRTRFVDAARVFGPQKGATADDVVLLTERLRSLRSRYLDEHGTDVGPLAGSGAAGGLAGGLAALGARLEPGFDLVAEAVGLDAALEGCDAVVTGEGRLDDTSLHGKVVGEVLRRASSSGRRAARAVVAGAGDAATVARLEADGVHVVTLTALATPGQDPLRDAEELARTAGRLMAQRLSRPGPASAGRR